jgi:hypothetical protein
MLEAKQLCGSHPAMAGQNRTRTIHEHRICKAELLDTATNLLDLRLRMSPCIAVVTMQRCYRLGLDPLGESDHRSPPSFWEATE